MTMRKHETLNGHTIEYEPSTKLAAFIDRLEEMLEDRRATEDEMVALAYSRDNPLLDDAIFPGRGAVTKEVLDDPAYQVMTDLLARKRVDEEGIDVAKLAARYTMTVAEAAEKLEIHESAVRQAIAARRLPSWMKDGRHYLDPRTVETFEVERRGPKKGGAIKGRTIDVRVGDAVSVTDEVKPDIVLRFGHGPGVACQVKHASGFETKRRIDKNVIEAELRDWRRVGIFTNSPTGGRFFVLEPSTEPGELEFPPFFARGRFRIAHKENNAARARAAFEAFQPA